MSVAQSLPIDISAGFTPSRFPQLDNRQLYNFYVNQGALYPTAGNKRISEFVYGKDGRGIFNSELLSRMVVVYDQRVFIVDEVGNHTLINPDLPLSTQESPVYIAENGVNQIGISDGEKFFIYDTDSLEFADITLPEGVKSGMVVFQDSYFIINSVGTNRYYVSDVNDGKMFDPLRFTTARGVITGLAAFKSQLIVFQNDLTDIYYDAGVVPFPYQRSNTSSYEYGCASRDSIARGEDYIFWLGVNRNSSPAIVYSNGSAPQAVSIGDIDFFISQLSKPLDCQGLVYELDGHTFYQLNWNTDNVSILYDLTENKFSLITDADGNISPVKQTAIFASKQYAIARNDGHIHEFGLDIPTVSDRTVSRYFTTINYQSKDIPLFNRQPNRRFGIRKISMDVEQGMVTSPNFDCEPDIPCKSAQCKMLVSQDKGVTYGNSRVIELAPIGSRKNLLEFFNLGSSRFWSFKFEFTSPERVSVFSAGMEVLA
jgi:hypothetical protein